MFPRHRWKAPRFRKLLVLMCSLVKYPFPSLQDGILVLLLIPFSSSETRWAFLETTAVMLHGRGDQIEWLFCNQVPESDSESAHPSNWGWHPSLWQIMSLLQIRSAFFFLIEWLCELEETELAPDVMASFPSDHQRCLQVSADSRFLSGRAGSCYCPADSLFLLWIVDLWEML